MGQYDKYPVRNSSGYVEYLTSEEIENLREMGDLGDVLSDRPGKTPPIARNPANQAAVNQLFYEKQQRKRGGRRRGGVRTVAEGIVTGVTAFSGLRAEPPVDQVYSAADAYDQSRSSVVDNRDEYLDEQTRATNDRKGGSGKRR